jgi:hypothetical protein
MSGRKAGVGPWRCQGPVPNGSKAINEAQDFLLDRPRRVHRAVSVTVVMGNNPIEVSSPMLEVPLKTGLRNLAWAGAVTGGSRIARPTF